MPTYRAFQVTGQRQFELVEREVVEPEPGHVRVRVLACGVCHSDFLGVEGVRPDPSQPIVPGHEIIGVVDAIGPGVTAWSVGERVGLGFLGGHCGECAQCRRGDFVNCLNQPQPGTSEDGGYAEMVYARSTGLVRVPESMNPIDAAPLLCAGITTFNALRHADAPPGAVVAIQGIGGLGHSACSTRSNSATGPSRSRAARTRPSWRDRWAPTTTSTVRRPTPALRCRNWAVPR